MTCHLRSPRGASADPPSVESARRKDPKTHLHLDCEAHGRDRHAGVESVCPGTSRLAVVATDTRNTDDAAVLQFRMPDRPARVRVGPPVHRVLHAAGTLSCRIRPPAVMVC